jgi:hypothetical protein
MLNCRFSMDVFERKYQSDIFDFKNNEIFQTFFTAPPDRDICKRNYDSLFGAFAEIVNNSRYVKIIFFTSNLISCLLSDANATFLKIHSEKIIKYSNTCFENFILIFVDDGCGMSPSKIKTKTIKKLMMFNS